MTIHDPNCIFCKIVAGTIPCYKLLENEHVLAFLDVGPLSLGHALIIPKGHWTTLDQLPDDTSAAIGSVLPKLSRAIRQATGIADFNILQNNGTLAHQAVGHVHFHIIPKTADTGLGINWPAGQLDADQAAKLVASITSVL
jgi:histidine triad (HIT) family protein